MYATIIYHLSQVGQKQSLLSKGDGKEKQSLQVEQGSGLFADVIRRSVVKSDSPGQVSTASTEA